MLYPVILSGGSGTRLWPLSRELHPKQLLCLTGNRTLLQDTVLRACELNGAVAPLFVCNEEHRFLVAEQVRELDKNPAEIMLEPIGRNTAPAATIAALSLSERNKTALMLIMPADHIVRNNAAFSKAIDSGRRLAEAGMLVTFGIVPTAPETGYGYIRCGKDNRVAEFVEKPDVATAQRYLTTGEYLWNGGIFLVRADVWLKEIEQYRPDILKACVAAFENGKRDTEFFRVDRQCFTDCPGDSIDYAVMEKTQHAAVVPLDAGWSDVGAWPALWEVCERDSVGNVTQGDVLVHDTKNTLIVSQHRLVAAVGLEDAIIVETSDAVLIAHKDKAQDVRKIVDQLKNTKRSEHKIHRRVYRPWGSYEGVDAGERFQVKRLVVKPGATLSLQMHHHRAEHWVVVCGTARVTRGDEVFMLTENQSTYIPLGVKHRLENPGNIPLEIIEVQSGGYLGEDDIVRFDDIYNRHKN